MLEIRFATPENGPRDEATAVIRELHTADRLTDLFLLEESAKGLAQQPTAPDKLLDEEQGEE